MPIIIHTNWQRQILPSKLMMSLGSSTEKVGYTVTLEKKRAA
jgi:hypothetical protein